MILYIENRYKNNDGAREKSSWKEKNANDTSKTVWKHQNNRYICGYMQYVGNGGDYMKIFFLWKCALFSFSNHPYDQEKPRTNERPNEWKEKNKMFKHEKYSLRAERA